MRTIRSILAIALLSGVLAVGAGASPASAQECSQNISGLRSGPFLLDTSTLQPTLLMEAQLDIMFCDSQGRLSHSGFGIPGRTVVFSAGGVEICRAVTVVFNGRGGGVASCPLASGNLLGVLLATATLQATVTFAGDGVFSPSSATVPAIGPPLFPRFLI